MQLIREVNDKALYLTLESEDDSSTLQNDLNILSAWETRWDMGFNPLKCHLVHVTGSKKPAVHVTGSKKPTKRDYILHGQVLESVNSARYLEWISLVPFPGIHTLTG